MNEKDKQDTREQIPYLVNLKPLQQAMVIAVVTCFEQANLAEKQAN